MASVIFDGTVECDTFDRKSFRLRSRRHDGCGTGRHAEKNGFPERFFPGQA